MTNICNKPEIIDSYGGKNAIMNAFDLIIRSNCKLDIYLEKRKQSIKFIKAVWDISNP